MRQKTARDALVDPTLQVRAEESRGPLDPSLASLPACAAVGKNPSPNRYFFCLTTRALAWKWGIWGEDEDPFPTPPKLCGFAPREDDSPHSVILKRRDPKRSCGLGVFCFFFFTQRW